MAEYIRIGEPANEAERVGFRLLRDTLPDHYAVLGNFDLRISGRRTSLEFDAVVIGEYGFFAVEIKGWTGLIRGGDRFWVLPWDRRSNPLSFLEKKTKALARFVRDRVEGGLDEDCFFAPALFFPRGEVQFDLPEAMMKSIVGPDGVYESFVDMELVRQKGPGPFRSRRKIEEVIDAIVAVSEPTDQDMYLPYYDVEGEREVDDRPYREFIGTHQYLQSRPKVRIKKYAMDSLATEAELREKQNRVLRDLEALELLDDNPYVARSYEMQPDYEDDLIFYLISEWIGQETLDDRIAELPDSQKGQRQRRWLAAHLIEAVASIHEAGIVHRNLSPDVIYMTDDEAGVPLKVADFDFSRVHTMDTISEGISALGTEGYAAPELWLDKEYDHRVDLFSVGAILFELLTSEVLFLGPGKMLRPDKVWEERGKLVGDEQLAEAIEGLISMEPGPRTEAFERVRKMLAMDEERTSAIGGG